MDPLIEKNPRQIDRFRRRISYFPNARTAFQAVLQSLQLKPGEKVLLPAFIGWSPREGSGVFDPIAALGLPYAFYRLDATLRIDLDDLHNALRSGHIRVLVIIHYFGRMDPAYRQAVSLARDAGVFLLEDEAHSMLTDLVAGECGRAGDAAIFSLHKLLPMPYGGALVLNRNSSFEHELDRASAQGTPQPDPALPSPWDYDLAEIAARRRANAKALPVLLQPLRGDVDPLWPEPLGDDILQTYPVLIRRASRFRLYELMNAAGFGVVALYHTLIKQIPCQQFPESFRIAERIMNLPVHQDADVSLLSQMVEEMRRSLDLLSSSAV